ncbi:unnamed protein product (mitochondrion) [Plasmodiophora brassicae]|uniref:Uncharacterized protein n=1 Tax=Plasmodiophora brassicae TaxID=37360 RepID=A0A3P3YC59_PLABS|nr:unnamed protein product [Plasmodiophora brassicae]
MLNRDHALSGSPMSASKAIVPLPKTVMSTGRQPAAQVVKGAPPPRICAGVWSTLKMTGSLSNHPMRCDALCVWVALDTYIRYARYIGPQPEDPMDPVLATLIVYQGNICNADTVDADVVRDKAVVVGPNFETACSQEQTYLAFQSKGAAAILSWSYTPGNMVYSHDGSRGARTRALKMLSLEFAYTDDVYNAMRSHRLHTKSF